jgi:hypothetical protein
MPSNQITPKEQAEKMIGQMGICIGTYQTDLIRRIAKHCAVVAVDGILAHDTQGYYSSEYWMKVKKELLKKDE